MQSLHIISSNNQELIKGRYTVTDEINGVPTLETETVNLSLEHDDPILMYSNAFPDVYNVVIKDEESFGDGRLLELTGVHSFVYQFTFNRLYETYSQYFSLENILNLVFNDTGFTFEVAADRQYYALSFENFGDKDLLSLVSQICERWELEYNIDGKHVSFSSKIGEDNQQVFRYKMNIAGSKVNFDASKGATYIEGTFGDAEKGTLFKKSLTSKLAENYGILHAEPYANKTITNEETMDRYLQQKLEETWSLSVEIDVVDLIGEGNVKKGDMVWAIDERLGIELKMRVIKTVKHYDMDDNIYLTTVTVGNRNFVDKYLDASNGVLSEIDDVRITSNRAIAALEAQFDNEFNAIRDDMKENHRLAKEDALKEVNALEQRMNSLYNQTSLDWTNEFNAAVQSAQQTAAENYQNMNNYVNTTVDSNRQEVENIISQSIADANSYATQQAEQKAAAVQSNLDAVTIDHGKMIQDAQDNILSINDFLGDRSTGLNEMLQSIQLDFERKLSNVDTWHYNMLRGTRFDEPDKIKVWNGSIKTDEEVPYYQYDKSPYQGYIEMTEEIQFESGRQYTLSFDAQTFGVKKMDYTFIIASPNDPVGTNVEIHRADVQDSGTNNNIFLYAQYRRYWIKFTPKRNILGTIRIGSNLVNNELGYSAFKIRLPYLTTTDNTRWLYHQLDSTQNFEEITRRIMQLEDGYEEFITKTEYNFKTGEIEGTIKSIQETVDISETLIQNHENWLLTNGSQVIQAAEEVSQKVWMSDIHNPNMIPSSRFINADNITQWTGRRAPLLYKHGDEWLQVRNTISDSHLGVISPKIPDKITAGETYTISWEAFFNISGVDQEFSYMYVMYSNSANQGLPRPKLVRTRPTTVEGVVRNVNIYELTFIANNSDNNAAILFGTNTELNRDLRFFMRYPKLELGGIATPYFNSFSGLTQRADEMLLVVQGVGEEGYLTQNDFTLTNDYWQLGSQRIDGDSIASVLRGTPNSIDAIVDQMNLTGNLNVKGQIEALSLDVIEGNFSRLFASQIDANVINVGHIQGRTAWFESQYILNANIERLVAQNVFTNAITTKTLNAIDVNAGAVRTSILTSNVITADHLDVGTIMVDKIFGTSGRIDQLLTKTHFSREVKAMSIEAVEADIAHVRSILLTADVIEAKHLQAGHALIDKIFSQEGYFETMMAKSGFVKNLNTVTIDTDQLTIRRQDGGVLIDRGMQRFGSPIITKAFPSSNVTFDNVNYVTTQRGTQTFERAYGEHSGRWANFSFRVGLRWDSEDASSMVGVVIRPNNMPYGITVATEVMEVIAYRSAMESHTINVRMPVPTFGATSFTLEFYRIGDESVNYVQIRSERCWTSA